MRSIWTAIATGGVVSVIAFGTAASAFAASHSKRHAAAATQDEMIDRSVQLAPRNVWSAVPPASWPGAYGCVTDEGYGRYGACDAGGGGS